MSHRRNHLHHSGQSSSTASIIAENPALLDGELDVVPQPLENEIRLRAYERWEAAGRPNGDGSEFWLDAERELRRKKPR